MSIGNWRVNGLGLKSLYYKVTELRGPVEFLMVSPASKWDWKVKGVGWKQSSTWSTWISLPAGGHFYLHYNISFLNSLIHNSATPWPLSAPPDWNYPIRSYYSYQVIDFIQWECGIHLNVTCPLGFCTPVQCHVTHDIGSTTQTIQSKHRTEIHQPISSQHWNTCSR